MKKRIAILGGGMSSLVTAFELTNQPGWKDRYEITVYQEGWRLGGKGASGRNAELGQRIEEHGLHILFGFYDNTFRVMRQCYDELARNPGEPLATWQDAFKPHDLVVMEEHIDGAWIPWATEFPRNAEVPGDPGVMLKPWDYVEMLLEWAARMFYESKVGPTRSAIAGHEVLSALASDTEQLRVHARAAMGAPEAGAARSGVLEAFEEALLGAWRVVTRGARAAGTLLREHPADALHLGLAHALVKSLPDDVARHDEGDHRAIIWLIDRFRAWARTIEADVEESTELRRLRILLDFSLSLARGLIADGLIFPPHDFFEIDDMDLRAWFAKHGAHEETLSSPVMLGPYDAAFAAFNEVGAGTGVHGILRMAFTYKGAVLWKMQAGMGDTIFTPLYRVLQRRGVTFHFFHQVDRLELTPDRAEVGRVHMTVQATTHDDAPYRPLVPVKGLECWPDRPHYGQLVQGEALAEMGADLEDWWTRWQGVGPKVLELGTDFDEVVLGISVGALPYIATELMEANPAFGKMATGVKTTQTRAGQLWFKPNLAGLGWEGPPPIVIPYAEPFDTWSDMSQLLVREDWPENTVGNLAYLCSPLPDDEPLPPRTDHDYPQRQRDRVHAELEAWLRDYTSGLWPTATDTNRPTSLNPWFLYDPNERDGWERLQAQYWRAVVSPSERYVLSVPSSVYDRLAPDDSGFTNLTLTGDWTLNFMSVGCLECATSAGVLAAQAIDPRVPGAMGDWLTPIRRTQGRAAARPAAPRPVVHAAPKPELPAWIVRDNDEIAFAPVKIDLTVYMFILTADYDKLTAMCDQQLNRGDAVYRPLAPMAVLYCSHVDNYPQVNPIGWVPEIDFGIWVPLLGGRKEGPFFVPDRVVTYTPYIWVDNGVALIGGRTVFGFAKELGKMVLPTSPDHAAKFTLDSLVVKKYAPDSMSEEARVLEVTRTDANLWQELEAIWRTGEGVLDGAAEALEQIFSGHDGLPLPTFASARKIIESMEHGMRMVFLKQFPDATQANRACYQAVVESNLPIISGVEGGWLGGEYEARLHRYDSVKIVETLGLSPVSTTGDVAVLRPLIHGWSRFTAMVQPGDVIWKRP